jgi:hypothetical protein
MQKFHRSVGRRPRLLFSVASTQLTERAFASSALRLSGKMMDGNPKANQPDSIARESRDDTPNTDPQSNASQEEHKSGDDHPAKQPDFQAEPSRTTGIGGQSEVKGGKEGINARDDK